MADFVRGGSVGSWKLPLLAMSFAPKERLHISLGQRPRNEQKYARALKARFIMMEARLQRSLTGHAIPWGVAPGWYESAPLALPDRRPDPVPAEELCDSCKYLIRSRRSKRDSRHR